MVKILYSVNGDGFGHATRSIPIIQALSKKHKVKAIVGSKRSRDFMKKYIKNVTAYDSVRFVYEKNCVNVNKTIRNNVSTVVGRSSTLRILYKFIKNYKPDVIVVDCDFATILTARMFDIPIICVCNIHAMTEMTYDVPKKYKRLYYTQKLLIKAFTSNVDYHVITTFFYLPVKKKNVFLYPPILRKEIIDITPQRKDYYLVYQTTATNNKLIRTLKSINAKFVVYGFEKDAVDDNVIFRKTNSDQFFKDFKDCRACIANGGYTFISEAVSLHKPVLSLPINGTFEQTLNGLEIKRLGYGDTCGTVSRKILLKFIKNNDRYYNRLKTHKKENNTRIIKKIEDLIKEVTT